MPGHSRGEPKLARKGKVDRARWFAGIVVMLLSFIMSLHPRAAQAGGASGGAASAPAALKAKTYASAGNDAAVKTLLLKLAAADVAGRKDILEQLARTGDQRLAQVFTDFAEGSLYVWNGQVVSCETFETDGGAKVAPLLDPLTRDPILAEGKPARVPAADVKLIDMSRRERVMVRDAGSLLQLSNPDNAARLAAVVKSGEGAIESNLPALVALDKTEKSAEVKSAIRESIALIQLANAGDDAAANDMRIAAANTLGGMRSARALGRLKDLQKSTPDPAAFRAYAVAIASIERWQSVVEWIGVAFSGLSASSILILMALGLSIIFGLMGVINMAHGELMMIGAYATYMTQQFFVNHLPEGAFDWYFIAAIPVSFVAAALVGMILEATVIRFLYGRPLDTLLATLGASFILIQLVRFEFGDNRSVSAPHWLRGSYEIMQDVDLPYNRLFIIAFCIGCIGLMYFIIEKTKLGLLLRATTQNRTMAASLGVSTRKIDLLTFGLGSGLAGMAGCALTQIGGVTPDMGQNYIIDSFLVVVVGGVGKLAGVIWSGTGLGAANKLLEPETGAVWAKVLILILVVAFIQFKPSGLFPAKGRLADG